MKCTTFLTLLLLCCFNVGAQIVDTLNQDVAPKGGTNQLAMVYYGIDFTKEQRNQIKNVEIEFIYSIDELGNIISSEINGVSDPIILDSLYNKTSELAPSPFQPSIQNGTPMPAVYFMWLTFPTHPVTNKTYGLLQGSAYREAELDDFEYLKESGQILHILMGGVANQFIGSPAEHLAFGGGMKVDMGFTAKNEYIYGLNMSFYGNKLKKDYPINSTREQFSAPPTYMIGLIFGKWFNKFNLQAELNLSGQNIIEKFGDNDPDWMQLEGWSPGIVLNYPIQFGKESPMYSYGAPSLLVNNLNLHFGLRYLDLSLKEASGLMAEFGISYRMEYKTVSEYKFKNEFLNRQ